MRMPSNAETGAYQQEYKKKMFYYETEQVRVHGSVLMKFFYARFGFMRRDIEYDAEKRMKCSAQVIPRATLQILCDQQVRR
jgi:hypothetical protein